MRVGFGLKKPTTSICYNNYFEKSGIGGSTDAVTYVYYTVNTPNVLQNINFIHNTFVDGGDIDLDKGSTNNTWANNIFKKSSGKILTASSASGICWAGNIYQGTLGLSIASGMLSADPMLVLNSDGYYGLSSTSPAIDASSSNYPPIMDIANIDDDPSLLLDISGQPRPAAITLKDVGCDEYTTGAITNRPLKLSDVGPSYLGGPSTGVSEDHSLNRQGILPSGFLLSEPYPNPFNPTTTIKFQIPSAVPVSLTIYDQLGREVTRLVDGIRSAGHYQVEWNAAKYAGGIYLCRLQVKDQIEIKKLLLLK